MPFSTFPGIDRHVALLDGAGFDMLLDGTGRHALTTPFEPFTFPGEASVTVTLQGGATRDFNLMVHRAFGVGEILCARSAGFFSIDTRCVMVIAARGLMHIDAGRLEPGDSWRSHRADIQPVTTRLEEGAAALIVNMHLHDHSEATAAQALQRVM